MRKKILDKFGEKLIKESYTRRIDILMDIKEKEKEKGNLDRQRIRKFLRNMTNEDMVEFKWIYEKLLFGNIHDLLVMFEETDFTIAYKDQDSNKLFDLKEICHEETDSYTLNAEFLEWMDKFREEK